MKSVIIYTDGACSGNPGPGGWGAVLIYCKNGYKEISGYNQSTTNNVMELTAVIEALKALKEPCVIDLYSDSAYVVNAFLNNWIGSWEKNDWKNSQKKQVCNIELWKELIKLSQEHTIMWHKVKGHADNQFNNKCDELATSQIKINEDK